MTRNERKIMRTMTWLFVAATAVMTMAAPQSRAQGKPTKDKSCLALLVGSPQVEPRETRWTKNPSFSAAKVIDLEVAILFSKSVAAQFDGVHMVEFRIYTPTGALYESIVIPMTTNRNRAGERHRVPGYPDLVPMQVLEGINHGLGQGMFAKVKLPIAGT
ncbi:MAG TPA: hypothetical protein VGQ36_17230, partial [Thermoanaerobaculia bacterium]|nr:hypothetical protein [Thermoanaerobaculia bacterium]